MGAKKKVCFIDTNVTANWIMAKGQVLSFLVEKYGLNEEFEKIYFQRYSDSVTFIEAVLNGEMGTENEFLLSTLSLQELFSAIRDELRSIVLFKNGVPISKWKDPRSNPDFTRDDFYDVYEKVLGSFDVLFQNRSIQPTNDIQPEDEDEYWNVYSSLLFLVKESQTQDVILLTTAIFNKADLFITKDMRLIRSMKKILLEKFGLQIAAPTNAKQILA